MRIIFNFLFLFFSFGQNLIKRKRNKLVAFAFVKFALKFNPFWRKLNFKILNIIFYEIILKMYQCNLSACKNADKPSIRRSIATVNVAQAEKAAIKSIKPYPLLWFKPILRTIVHKTSDNSLKIRKLNIFLFFILIYYLKPSNNAPRILFWS